MKNENIPYIEEDEIDLLELFGVINRYKWFIIIPTIVVALLTIAIAVRSIKLPPEKSFLPNKYKASALILIHESSNGGGVSSMLSSSGLGSLAGLAGISVPTTSYGELAKKLIESRTVLDTIAKEFNIVQRYKIKEHVIGNSRKALLKRLSYKYDDKTNTLSISYEDYDPVFAKKVVNRVVELLADRFSTIGGSKNLIQKDLLEGKLVDVKAEMTRLENKIKDFQTKYGVLDVQTLATEQITVLGQLKSQLILKEMEIKTYSQFTRIDDPALKRLKAEKDNLKNLINEMEMGYSKYEGTFLPQKDIPKLAIKFGHLKRDLLVQEKIYELLTQQYELVKLSLAGEEPIFQVLELADVPDLKSGPHRSRIIVIATILAFFLSIIFVFILNSIKNIKEDPERLAKLKGIKNAYK